MLEPERLARALADEMRFTASKDLLVLIAALIAALTGPHDGGVGGFPHEEPHYLLGRSPEWRALVERALEVADA